MTATGPEYLWSVTTLIDVGLPKQALIGWAAKATSEYAVSEAPPDDDEGQAA